MSLMKALATLLVLGSVYAHAATLDCQAVSQDMGGRVRIVTRGGNESGLSFQLIKNDTTVGRLDFVAPPTTVVRENLNSQEVPFLRFYDSVSSPSVVVTSVLYAEESLLKGQTAQGLVVLQQQNTEQFLCRPATN